MRSLLCRVCAACALSVLVVQRPVPAASVFSDFEDGTFQGWSAVGDVQSVSNPGSGGNPGGYCRMDDRAVGGVVWMVAPAEYLGNWHSKTSLSVDLTQFAFSGSQFSTVKFEISGPGGTYTRVFGERPPKGLWRTYGTTLDEALWVRGSGTWDALLDDVTQLRILLEFIDGDEQNGMDNVALLEECTVVTPGVAKTLPDTTCVRVSGTVTRILDDAMYIEAADRSAGLRVKNSFALQEGDVVHLNGLMATTSGNERVLENASVESVSPGEKLRPLHIQGRLLGGRANSALDPPVGSAGNLKNTGQLVSITGRVEPSGHASLAALNDGSGVAYARMRPETAVPVPGSFLTLTGISSTDSGNPLFPALTGAVEKGLLTLPIGANLIRNPGAEEGASSTGAVVRPVPGWQPTSNFSVANYGSVNVTVAEGESIGGGRSFFYGGQNNAYSDAVQTIDVTPLASLIDAGAQAHLSAYMGGYGTQNDQGTVIVTFLDSGGASLGTCQVGPQGGSNQKMIFHEQTAAVPPGTRSLEVKMTAKRNAGAENSVFIDNLSLSLSPAASP